MSIPELGINLESREWWEPTLQCEIIERDSLGAHGKHLWYPLRSSPLTLTWMEQNPVSFCQREAGVLIRREDNFQRSERRQFQNANTLPTKPSSQGHGFPVVTYGCESWTLKKAEHWIIDAFELWCWRRLLRVPWTARRANRYILKKISPKYSSEGLMLKLKFQ